MKLILDIEHLSEEIWNELHGLLAKHAHAQNIGVIDPISGESITVQPASGDGQVPPPPGGGSTN